MFLEIVLNPGAPFKVPVSSPFTVFPAISKDLWGMRKFGGNYGLLYTSWGLGGFALSRVSQMIKASTGTLEYSFLLGGVLMLIGSVLLLYLERNMKQYR